MSKQKFKHIVLSGGGILSCAHIGFLDVLFEQDLIASSGLEIHGTSAGSIVGLMFIIGMPPKEMISKVMKWTTSSLLVLSDLHALEENYGMDNGEYLRAILMDLLFSRGFSHDETLLSLFEKTQIGLNITVTNINMSKSEVWNYKNKPNTKVVDAIYASSSIPLLFSPMRTFSDVIYVDGGIRDNYPVPQNVPCHEVVGCELVSWKQCDVTSFESYIVSVLSCLMMQQNDVHRSVTTVSIDCSDMTYFNFDISEEERMMLYKRGYDGALKRLSRAIS